MKYIIKLVFISLLINNVHAFSSRKECERAVANCSKGQLCMTCNGYNK